MVSIFFYDHPYLGQWSNLTNIFQVGWNHRNKWRYNLIPLITGDFTGPNLQEVIKGPVSLGNSLRLAFHSTGAGVWPMLSHASPVILGGRFRNTEDMAFIVISHIRIWFYDIYIYMFIHILLTVYLWHVSFTNKVNKCFFHTRITYGSCEFLPTSTVAGVGFVSRKLCGLLPPALRTQVSSKGKKHPVARPWRWNGALGVLLFSFYRSTFRV